VAAVEEEHTGPHIDRELVTAGEVVIETGKEESLDPSVAFTIRPLGRGAVRSKRVSHSDEVRENVRSSRDYTAGTATSKVQFPTPKARGSRERGGRRSGLPKWQRLSPGGFDRLALGVGNWQLEVDLSTTL
jgi:hypothetical protein